MKTNIEYSNGLKVDYRPKLYIDTEPLKNETLENKAYEEIDKGSITPTTFESRTFFSTKEKEFTNFGNDVQQREESLKGYDVNLKNFPLIKASKNVVTLLDNTLSHEIEDLKKCHNLFKFCQSFISNSDLLFYQDEYTNGDVSVKRYGINTAWDNLKKIVVHYNENSEDVKQFKIPENEQITQKKVSKSNKSENSGQSNKIAKSSIGLHPLEAYLVREAIESIKLKNNRVVLVDIFAKDSSGKIKYEKNIGPEIHTVVLYRSNCTQFFVIDPSNSDFSKHLAGSVVEQLISVGKSLIEILVPTKNIKIYQPSEGANEQKLIGPKFNQWRDCVDIAVKIAFGLSKEKNLEIGNIDEIKNFSTVKLISNNSIINDSVPDDATNNKSYVKFPLRIQQKSNAKIGEDFYKFSKKIKENLIAISQGEISKKYIKVFTDSDKNPNEYTLHELDSICRDTFLQMKKEIEEQEMQILGKTFNPNLYNFKI